MRPHLDYVLLDVKPLIHVLVKSDHLGGWDDFVPEWSDEQDRFLDLRNSLDGFPVVALQEF